MAEDQFVSPDEKSYSPQEMPEEGDLGALEVAPEELSSYELEKQQQAQELTEQEQQFFGSQPGPNAIANYQQAEELEAEQRDAEEAAVEEAENAASEDEVKEAATKKAFYWGTVFFLLLPPLSVSFLRKPLNAELELAIYKAFKPPIMNPQASKNYAPYSKFRKGLALTMINAAPYYMIILLVLFALIVIVSVIRVYCGNMTVWDKILNTTAWYACSQITE